MELLFLIFSPIVGAIICFCLKNRRLVEYVSVFAGVVSLFSALRIAVLVSQNGAYNFSKFFLVDSFGALVILIIAIIGFASLLYSVGYLRAEVAKEIIGFRRVRQCFVLLSLFLSAMFLAVSSASPVLTWIFIEATTLSTAFLISFYNKKSATEAAWKYLIINSVGLLLGFFGTILFFAASSLEEFGFITWQTLLEQAGTFNPTLVKIAFAFILIGYGTKMGLAPMHTWLPDAHSNAPSPISALLSGVLLNVAFLTIMRFKIITDETVGGLYTGHLLIFFGLLSIVIAVFTIFTQKSYKRLLAYSSIENMGIMALGFGFGGLGAFGAVFHMIYHALLKASLFFSAGNLLLKYGSSKIRNVTGALFVLPYTSWLFIAGSFAIIGLPPFGIFLSKFFIAIASIDNYLWILAIILPCFAVVFAGFLKHLHSMVFGAIQKEVVKGEAGIWTVIPPVALLVIALVLGFWMPPFIAILVGGAIVGY